QPTQIEVRMKSSSKKADRSKRNARIWSKDSAALRAVEHEASDQQYGGARGRAEEGKLKGRIATSRSLDTSATPVDTACTVACNGASIEPCEVAQNAQATSTLVTPLSRCSGCIATPSCATRNRTAASDRIQR